MKCYQVITACRLHNGLMHLFQYPQGPDDFLFTFAPTLALGFTNWISGIKWPERAASLPSVSSFEVRNEWNLPSFPHIFQRAVLGKAHGQILLYHHHNHHPLCFLWCTTLMLLQVSFNRTTYLPTYLPTYLRTYLHTYLRTYLHRYIPTYLHTYLPAYLPATYLHTYLPTYVPTYLRTCLPT